MAWAVWGMKDRLLRDPDVWLCHQCNDCSTRCPRGARPGEVLSAVRRQCVQHYSFPRFLARWVNRPQYFPLLLAIPVLLLTLGLVARVPIENALGLSRQAGERIVYSYSSVFPHWMLNTLFGVFSLLALALVLVGVLRFWSAMKQDVPRDRIAARGKGLIRSILVTFKRVITHEQFALCTRAHPRFYSHVCVLFGFLALSAVTVWVITANHNPLIRGEFVYPFGFWNPWKLLANIGGVALVAGCLLMIRERLLNEERVGSGGYSDWALLVKLLLVAATGFVTEVLHYLRLEPHRHIAYFVHLVFVFVVLVYLPYSKLAHLVYRFAAMVFAEYSGRNAGSSAMAAESGQDAVQEGYVDVGKVAARN